MSAPYQFVGGYPTAGPGAPAFDGTWQLPDFTRTAGSIRE